MARMITVEKKAEGMYLAREAAVELEGVGHSMAEAIGRLAVHRAAEWGLTIIKEVAAPGPLAAPFFSGPPCEEH